MGVEVVNARNCKELPVLDSLMEEDLGASVADELGPGFRCRKHTTKVASDIHPQHIHILGRPF